MTIRGDEGSRAYQLYRNVFQPFLGSSSHACQRPANAQLGKAFEAEALDESLGSRSSGAALRTDFPICLVENKRKRHDQTKKSVYDNNTNAPAAGKYVCGSLKRSQAQPPEDLVQKCRRFKNRSNAKSQLT